MAKTRTVTGQGKRPGAVAASKPKLTAPEVEFVKALYQQVSNSERLRRVFRDAFERARSDHGER